MAYGAPPPQVCAALLEAGVQEPICCALTGFSPCILGWRAPCMAAPACWPTRPSRTPPLPLQYGAPQGYPPPPQAYPPPQGWQQPRY